MSGDYIGFHVTNSNNKYNTMYLQ